MSSNSENDPIYFTIGDKNEKIPYLIEKAYQDNTNIVFALKEICNEKNYIYLSIDIFNFERFKESLNIFSKSPKYIDLHNLDSFRYISKPEKFSTEYNKVIMSSLNFKDNLIYFTFNKFAIEVTLDYQQKEIQNEIQKLNDPESSISIFTNAFKKMDQKIIEKIGKSNIIINESDLYAHNINDKNEFIYDQIKVIKKILGYDIDIDDTTFVIKMLSEEAQKVNLNFIFSIDRFQEFKNICNIIEINKKDLVMHKFDDLDKNQYKSLESYGININRVRKY